MCGVSRTLAVLSHVDFATYLDQEWRPALGCTEPAAVAHAAACAAAQAGGELRAVHVVCDRRVFKNSFAAGIPHSGGRTGVDWAAACGALLAGATDGLECFRRLTAAHLDQAARLIQAGAVTVALEAERDDFLVDCRVTGAAGEGRAVLQGDHTRLVRLEREGHAVALPAPTAVADRERVDAWLGGSSFTDFLRLAHDLGHADRERLRRGTELNLDMARHGLAFLPADFVAASEEHLQGRASCLVCAGIVARMKGEERTVMTLAGSGSKGMTVTVPLALWCQEKGVAPEEADIALALGCLLTSATTQRLGTLSSMCGCANAAGIGLTAGLVFLQGGDEEVLSRAVNNMVANVTGVICDGAKVGCGLKATTGVDAAFRASSLALGGFGIAHTDGIVCAEGARSLDNLERVARQGMGAMEAEILRIMQEKHVN